jgi:hypothetical protein
MARPRCLLERYNTVSLKNVQDADAKLDAWSKNRKSRKTGRTKAARPSSPAERERHELNQNIYEDPDLVHRQVRPVRAQPA